MRVRLPGGLEITFVQVLLVAGIVFYSLAIPGDLDYKLDALGFGVCHQIPSHSFTIAGHQLPLCARCTGIYLSALSALVLLAILRRRASRFPARHIIAVFGVFFGAMVLDGINSTLQAFGSGFWDSGNLLRIFTGTLAGVSVAFMFYPVFNMSLWHPDVAEREHVIEQPFELVGYMVAAGILVALVLDGGDWLYYPLSFLSVIGMMALLTMANTIIVLIFTRREGVARTFSAALTPILVGVLITLIELTLLAWGRASLAPYLANNNLGLPLVPGLR
jgi:uncharacterized membrane protein